jgi:D-threo-aldose 1-dehydrogenase
LATGPVAGASYDYSPAPPEIQERVARLSKVCSEFAIPLPAAALQFPLFHSAIASLVVGAATASEVERNIDFLEVSIPAAFWDRLKELQLISSDAPTKKAMVAA